MEKVVKVTVFFKDIGNFRAFNEVYAEYFPQKPARSAVQVARLPLDVDVEMELIAMR